MLSLTAAHKGNTNWCVWSFELYSDLHQQRTGSYKFKLDYKSAWNYRAIMLAHEQNVRGFLQACAILRYYRPYMISGVFPADCIITPDLTTATHYAFSKKNIELSHNNAKGGLLYRQLDTSWKPRPLPPSRTPHLAFGNWRIFSVH